MINIIVERGATKPLAQLPPKSIALDGYVQGPEVDLDNQRFSFDHHDKCIRTFTRSTCQQVMDAILLGFNPDGYTVYVNDVDADTTLACWLLQNPHLVYRTYIRALVEAVGALDAHGPAYPLPEGSMLAEIYFEGVMAPEKDARRNATYGTCDLDSLLLTCLQRTSDMINDDENFGIDAADNPEPVHYYVQHQGKGWSVVYSEGFAFPTLYDDGFTAVILSSELPDGSWAYTVAKKSEFVNFPVGPVSKPGTILHMLAKEEPGWGGGSTIGGAPRNPDGSRSKLPPAKVFALVSDLLFRKAWKAEERADHIGAEANDLPDMMNDKLLQAARATAEEALAEEN